MTLWKSMLFKKSTLLMFLLMPLLVFFVVVPLFDQTVEDLQVAVHVVDPYEQTAVHELIEKMDNPEPFNVQLQDELDLQSLARGEVEAIFVVEDQLAKKVQDGDVAELFTWYRYDNSLVDGLFKEYMASTLMEDIVRKEAANLVVDEMHTVDWQEVYDYSSRYFEPEPLFQMNYESYRESTNHSEGSEALYPLLLIWGYIWLLMIYLTSFIEHWRDKQLIERLSIYRYGQVKLYGSWFIITTVSVSLLITIIVMFSSWFNPESLGLTNLPKLVIISFVSALLLLMLSILLRSRQAFLAVTLSYLIVAVALFMLVDWQILESNWWSGLFIPFWLG
ncbi:ABC transporter permease [Alkalibacillus silvisoli]|uniref:ABC-2 type transporter transmembrane domain-containing protein n=1 Tax=Alkalibacillus silvisoli TaxID=392823 RepID=A0ABN1A9L1_9BACI